MSATMCMKIEVARRRVREMEYSLLIYADYPAAVARISGNLEVARRALEEMGAGG